MGGLLAASAAGGRGDPRWGALGRERILDLAARLEGRGFRVAVFPEGRSALERILADGCDLVVSEAMVPRLSGFQLREALMADSARSRIPFVLVSHRKDDEYLEKAASLRITHYLKKPYALAEILGLAENLARG